MEVVLETEKISTFSAKSFSQDVVSAHIQLRGKHHKVEFSCWSVAPQPLQLPVTIWTMFPSVTHLKHKEAQGATKGIVQFLC